jgi:hypothetical protein
MASHIDPAMYMGQNALKISFMVLFIEIYILAEFFLKHLSFRSYKECFL